MNFDECVLAILHHEGGYVNDANDPGGETKYGISKRAFPRIDIKDLSVMQAKAIYKQYYWDLCDCESLPPWARLLVFDCAVNQGPSRAILDLQRTCGAIPDGIIGPQTLERLRLMDAGFFITEYSKRRFSRYYSNPKWRYYGGGWTKRLMDITARSFKFVIRELQFEKEN